MTAIERISADPRVTMRKPGPPNWEGRCIVYWMQRSQRVLDNPALDVAIKIGNELKRPVVAFFAPVPFYPNANLRHYRFLADGVADIAEGLAHRKVGFVFRAYPEHSLQKFCEEVDPCIVIGDENPMREPEEWRSRAAQQLHVPLWTVDSDVIVPTKMLEKEQYAARTIRPRIHRLLPEFLVRPKKSGAHVGWIAPNGLQSLSWREDFTKRWKLDRSVAPVADFVGGAMQAQRALKKFLRKLTQYPEQRNCPECEGTSRLSPYLHFGHIGPLTVALAVQGTGAPKRSKEAFLEQLIVRRELAINFVRFNPYYDSIECLEPWAQRTIGDHAKDHRPTLYSEGQLEQAETHDPLWNAAQKQMVLSGWMHNHLRMYWAKKVLEWSPSVAIAYQRAVWLNDRYELDGRDPNGYAGIAWALVGKHDRPWFERPIFGHVRYMSLASTSKKFDSKRYIEKVTALETDGRA